jgi:hypothetical protein
MYRIITIFIYGFDTLHRLKFSRIQKLRSFSVLKHIYGYLFYSNCSTLSSNFYVTIIFSNLLLNSSVFKCGIIIIYYWRIHILLYFFIFKFTMETDRDWRDLLPLLGYRNCIREQYSLIYLLACHGWKTMITYWPVMVERLWRNCISHTAVPQ